MNEYIRFTKIDAGAKAKFPTPDATDYNYGEDNPMTSLPVQYTVTGKLISDIEVGKSIKIDRDTRNGEEVSGTLATSAVTEIEPLDGNLLIHTENSIYKLEWLKQTQ